MKREEGRVKSEEGRVKREEGRGKRKSVEPPQNAASYQSQNFAEKRLYGVGNRAASGTTAPTPGRPYRLFIARRLVPVPQ